jgi:hypothetical protein
MFLGVGQSLDGRHCRGLIGNCSLVTSLYLGAGQSLDLTAHNDPSIGIIS